ncbi:MAG TPA: hypothetical protein VIM55_05860 [Mucilaginibacter sp.]
MGAKIFFFNIIYYAVTLGLVGLGREDPNSSLGYGIMIVVFWIVALVFLIVSLRTKFLAPKSFIQKVGIFTLTPVLFLIVVTLIASFEG